MEHVEEGTSIYTDALMSYMGLNQKFQHDVIDHAERYVNATKDVNINDGDRFRIALGQIVGKRLTFEEVTGKVGQRAA